jgi:hypothetical protein
MELFFVGLGDEGCGMSEKIWSADYIRENPELAAKAIETLQEALKNTEYELNRIRAKLMEVSKWLAEEKKEM